MKKRFLAIVMVLLACQLYAQNYYTVTSKTLSVRNAPRKGADVISMLYKDDNVDVLEYGPSWSKVAIGGNAYGYVSSKLIKKAEPIDNRGAMAGSLATDTQQAQQDSLGQNQQHKAAAADRSKITFIIMFFIVCLAVILIALGIYQLRCKKCKRWFAMKQISKEIVSQNQTTRRKLYDQRDAQGNKTGTIEGRIPATTTEYLITRQCKHCGAISTSTYTNTVRDDMPW